MKKIMNRSYASAFLLVFMVNYTQGSPVMLGKVLMRTLIAGGVGSGVLYGNQQLATDNKINIDGPMLAVKEGVSFVQDGLFRLAERASQLLPYATLPQASAPSDAIADSGAPAASMPVPTVTPLLDVDTDIVLNVNTEPMGNQSLLPEGATPRPMTPAFSIRQVIKPVLVVCAVVCVTYGAYKAYEYYKAQRAKKA